MSSTKSKEIKKRSGATKFAKIMREVAPLMHFAWSLVAGIAIFAYLGNILDEKYEMTPWLMLSGVLIGIFIGFFNFYRIVKKMSYKADK